MPFLVILEIVTNLSQDFLKVQIHFIVHLPLDTSDNILLNPQFSQLAIIWLGTLGPLNLTPESGCCNCQNGQWWRSHGYMGSEWLSGLIFPQMKNLRPGKLIVVPSVHSWLVAGISLESEILNSYFLAFFCYISLCSVPCRKHRRYFV